MGLLAFRTAVKAPTGLTATALTSATISVSWTAPGGFTIATYELERSLDGVSGWTQIYAASAVSTVSGGLAENTTYYYRVRALDSQGNYSPYSSIANARTLIASTGASLVDGILTVVGSNFGIKVTPAPHRFFDLINEANGTLATAVSGLDSSGNIIAMEQYNADSSIPRAFVAVSDPPVGKALVTTFTAVEQGGDTPAMGSFLPSGTNKIFASFWLKITHDGAVMTRLPQWKASRSGQFGVNPHSDGNNNYQASGVKIHAEFYTDPAGTVSINSGFAPIFADSGNNGHDFTNGSPNEVSGWSSFRPGYNMFSGWHHWQMVYDTGTIGNADGNMRWYCDGALVGKLTGKAVRLAGSTANPLEHFQYLTGLQLLNVRTYTMSVARCYLDTTEARVELINASTYAAATGFITVRASSWTSTLVRGPAPTVTGYNWAAVTNASGVTQVEPL